MVRYFALKTPLKNAACNRKQEDYLYFPVFPGISHFEGIGQGGISREIPPGKYRPGISRTTLHTYKHIRTDKDSYKYSFYPRTIIQWNLLPIHHEAATVDAFKALIPVTVLTPIPRLNDHHICI